MLVWRPYVYPVLGYRVVDGDSIEVRFDRGWSRYGDLCLYCRVVSVDAPERHTEAGKLVKAVVERWFADRDEELLSGHLLWNRSTEINTGTGLQATCLLSRNRSKHFQDISWDTVLRKSTSTESENGQRKTLTECPKDVESLCPVCRSTSLTAVRAKLICTRCHSIVVTCCEGGRGD